MISLTRKEVIWVVIGTIICIVFKNVGHAVQIIALAGFVLIGFVALVGGFANLFSGMIKDWWKNP